MRKVKISVRMQVKMWLLLSVLSIILMSYITANINIEDGYTQVVLMIMPIFFCRTALLIDSVEKIKRFSLDRGIIDIIAISYVASIIGVSALFYIKFNIYGNEKMLIGIMRNLGITIAILLDYKFYAECKSKIKCSKFVFYNKCYKKSCINCKQLKVNDMRINDKIKIELVKNYHIYYDHQKERYNRIINDIANSHDHLKIKDMLTDYYEDENFEEQFIRY